MKCPHCDQDIDRIIKTPLDCWCNVCNPHAWWMIVHPDCGDKRCPKAADHRADCEHGT